MNKILYVGNKLEKWGKTPTAVDLLPDLLRKEGLNIEAVSDRKNKFFRLIYMITHCALGNYQKIIIDTYSTQNFIYAKVCGTIARFRGIDYYFVLHGGALDQKISNSGKFVRGLFRNAKKLIAPSDHFYKKFEKLEFQNLICIPNSINIKHYSYKVREQVKPKLLWLRSFQELYNPNLAIQVFQILQKDYTHVELCMIGPEKDGSLAKLKLMVEKDHVLFPGRLSKKDIVEKSTEYFIFLNTSNIDNTPISVIEAMALGLPVVSTNVGGIPSLIEDGVSGLLVPPNGPEAMAEACRKLILNPDLASKLSRNARAKVEKFDWEQVKFQWLDLLS